MGSFRWYKFSYKLLNYNAAQNSDIERIAHSTFAVFMINALNTKIQAFPPNESNPLG